MDQNLTEVICILDASGSMNHLADDVVGGYNVFIDQQKEDKGQTKVTLVTLYHRVPFLSRLSLQDATHRGLLPARQVSY